MAGGSDSLVALFRGLAQLSILDEGSPNAFRVRAYENAVEAISSYRGDLQALSERELTASAGIGQSAEDASWWPSSAASRGSKCLSAARRCSSPASCRARTDAHRVLPVGSTA